MKKISRRSFGKRALAAAAFPAIVPASALGADGHTAPSERIVVGCIGVGNRGRGIMGSALSVRGTQVVAVCDVKPDCREKAAAMVNKTYDNADCAMFNEHEAITSRDDIDACIVGSCDHWHVLHALAATRAKKDVYVEKPLGVTLAQDQALRSAVHEHKTIFQFGTQQRSQREFHRACQLVRNGRVGELKTIRVWAPPSVAGGPTEEVPVPEGLDYDRWLGPAPFTPHTKDRTSNAWWWFISDYALGFIAGWGIHPVDIALWGAGDKLRTPVDIEGTGIFPTEGVCNTATQWNVSLRYDSGVEVAFHSDPPPAEWKTRYGEITGHGTVFEGTEGWVLVDRGQVRASSEAIANSEIGEDEEQLYLSRHHMRNFFKCVVSREDAISEINEAVEGDAICHISDIAIRLGRKLRWNPKTERFENDDEANARLSGPMRAPWSL